MNDTNYHKLFGGNKLSCLAGCMVLEETVFDKDTFPFLLKDKKSGKFRFSLSVSSENSVSDLVVLSNNAFAAYGQITLNEECGNLFSVEQLSKIAHLDGKNFGVVIW